LIPATHNHVSAVASSMRISRTHAARPLINASGSIVFAFKQSAQGLDQESSLTASVFQTLWMQLGLLSSTLSMYC
jgi:hypothetical protein